MAGKLQHDLLNVQETEGRAEAYMAVLKQAGADVVVANIEELNAEMVDWLVRPGSNR